MSRLLGLDWRKSWSSQDSLTKGLSKSLLFLLSVSSGGRAAPVCCDHSLFGIVREITPQLYAKTHKKSPGFSLLCLGEGRAIIYLLPGFRVAWRPMVGLWDTSWNHLFIGVYSSWNNPTIWWNFYEVKNIIYAGSQAGIYYFISWLRLFRLLYLFWSCGTW